MLSHTLAAARESALDAWLDASEAKSFSVAGLRTALSQGQPGHWASDHREETNQFTGWNYIAIHRLAQQVGAGRRQLLLWPERRAKALSQVAWRAGVRRFVPCRRLAAQDDPQSLRWRER